MHVHTQHQSYQRKRGGGGGGGHIALEEVQSTPIHLEENEEEFVEFVFADKTATLTKIT